MSKHTLTHGQYTLPVQQQTITINCGNAQITLDISRIEEDGSATLVAFFGHLDDYSEMRWRCLVKDND